MRHTVLEKKKKKKITENFTGKKTKPKRKKKKKGYENFKYNDH